VEERERERGRERGSTWGRWEKEPHPTGFVRFGGSEESEEESSDDHTFFLRFFFKGRDCSRERRKEYVTHRRSAPECPRMGNSVGKRCAPLFFPSFLGEKRWHALPVHHGVCFGLEMQSAGKPESTSLFFSGERRGVCVCAGRGRRRGGLFDTGSYKSTPPTQGDTLTHSPQGEKRRGLLPYIFDSPHRTIALQHQLLA
jgi:hypothetical protein